jgi:hypothetical protein
LYEAKVSRDQHSVGVPHMWETALRWTAHR